MTEEEKLAGVMDAVKDLTKAFERLADALEGMARTHHRIAETIEDTVRQLGEEEEKEQTQ
jgi:hypothetical protein